MLCKKNSVQPAVRNMILTAIFAIIVAGCATKVSSSATYTTKTVHDGKTPFILVQNPNGGPVLGFSQTSGVKLLDVTDGSYTYAFKDLNKNGSLDVWEDWRVDPTKRAAALSKELSVEQIAGLMLFSSHERNIEEGLTDVQKNYLNNNNLRAVLNAGSNNVKAAVQWNNAMQAYVESLSCAVPVNFSSDPRSTAGSGDQYSSMISGSDVSFWPSNLGLAATFDTNIMYRFAKDVSAEYRAMGIVTALGPQIDLATEPRWLRVNGTFGEDTKLAVAMTQAYVDGSQSTYDKNGKDIGWGADSINCMIKHWPGDGSGEAGRESHRESGKFAVYPGNNYAEHLKPFTLGGFKLKGKTASATAVMTSYSIGLNADGTPIGEQAVGSAYNTHKMAELRNTNKFDGVVCTDWSVTKAFGENGSKTGTAWGEENRTVTERHYDLLMNGVDMFGGNNDSKPVIEAYSMMVSKMGEDAARKRFEQSATRILKLMLVPGLFENPYLDLEKSTAIVGSADKRTAGYNAQLSSVVMLKNSESLIATANGSAKTKTVYIPMTYLESIPGPFGASEAAWLETMSVSIAEQFFKKIITDTPIKDSSGKITGYETPDLSTVDLAIVGMSSPNNGSNFSSAGLFTDENGKKTFYPLSLQYAPYTATTGRHVSISGNIDSAGTKENRSYNGQSSNLYNSYDIVAFQRTMDAIKKTGKDIPVILCMKANNPVCFAEVEPDCDTILTGFSVSDQAFFDIIAGNFEPKGLLPVQMPKNMDAVERQLEDIGRDMDCYVDSVENTYDFAYGLNYKGVIKDVRVKKYSK